MLRSIVLPLSLAFISQMATTAHASDIHQINYEGFTVWVDCSRKGPTLFHYLAEADSGNFDRHSDYTVDPAFDALCQSSSSDTFQSVIDEDGIRYDVGHQVPANHLDGSEVGIGQTNYWTNLLPQTASMNRGAWLVTEEIIECTRDEVSLNVWGGPIWGSNFEDDYFADSHGVRTPSAFWKVVIRTDNKEGIAWIIPNGHAPRSSLDDWLVSISLAERITGRSFDAVNKDVQLETSWPVPNNDCKS